MAGWDGSQERRKSSRVTVDAYVAAILNGGQIASEAVFISKDISSEGVFLFSKKLVFPVGTIIDLKIHTPVTREPISAQAKVIRITKDEVVQVNGMGLVFMQISAKDKKELLRHLYLAHHYLEQK